MSEMQPEGGGGGGNVFTRKLGPLPMWGWMAIALLVALGYYLYKKNQSGATSTAASGTSPSTVNTPGGVDASLVPQFVNQDYTNVQAPAAPNVTVNNTLPPPTTSTPTTPPPTTAPKTTPLNEVLQKGHVLSANPAKTVIGWTIAQKSPNATQLLVQLDGPGLKNFQRIIPASATTATFDNLEPGHDYVAYITPQDAQGQAVGGPNTVNIVTSKAA